MRVQIQGPDGARDDEIGENDRWCYTIEEVQGPIFAQYSEFNTRCWDGSGNPYNGEPISAIVFLVPGTTQDTPFDFCVNGFADGNSVDDAPEGGEDAPLLSGTIGGTDEIGSTDPDYERVKVLGDDGHSYIIQNNNWGNASGSEQTIEYEGNSFRIVQSTGTGGGGQGVPASFPSIYVGANGSTLNGMSTSADDNLPIQVSSISSINSELSWSGGTGNFNISYDIWFANTIPTTEYDDAISGFVMVWLYDPAENQPIGSVVGQVTIGGMTYDVWSGVRGGSGANANAPVISYVATSTMNTFNGDLNLFIADATSRGIDSSWYLTDIFGGVEIWNGPSAVGVEITRFAVDVQ